MNDVSTASTFPQTVDAAEKEAEKEFRYAGFWIRVLANLIDSLIFSILFSLFFSVAMQSESLASLSLQSLVSAVYTICFWVYFSATPGKMVLGLKVIKTDGSEVGWKEAVIRYLGYIVSSIPFGLGFLWVAFDKRKQGWHDKMAGTYVVHTKFLSER